MNNSGSASDATAWSDHDLAYWHEPPRCRPPTTSPRIPPAPPMPALVHADMTPAATSQLRSSPRGHLERPRPRRPAARRSARPPSSSSSAPPPGRTSRQQQRLQRRLHHYPYFLQRQAYPPLPFPTPLPLLQTSTAAAPIDRATHDLFTALAFLDQSLRAVDSAFGALVAAALARGDTNFHFPQIDSIISLSRSAQSAMATFVHRHGALGPNALLPHSRPLP